MIPFNLHRVALRTTSPTSCSERPRETVQPVGDAGGHARVVHVNVDRRVQRRRRRVRAETDACDLRRRTVTRQQLLRARVHTGNRQDLGYLSGKVAVAEQHQDFFPDLGIEQALIGNVPIHEDIGWIEDFGDRSARHQRLADMRETCRDYAGNWRRDPAAAEVGLHVHRGDF